MALTQEQIAIVKSTVPVLQEHGNTITTIFYRNMLGAHPELNSMFSLRNQQTGAQPRALAKSVLAYASHIDDIPKLQHAVERIAQKHASLYVQAEQYNIVGEFLMGAIAIVLGDALTPEIAEAWTAAYAQLADVFVQREAQLYKEAGPWTNWRKFKITRREAESDTVTSFYLEPTDGAPLPTFKPGQYVSLQIPLARLDGLKQSRQFSLSDAPKANSTHYRISVKREDTIRDALVEDLKAGKVPGLISNMLHDQFHAGDEVELSHPQGEFFVNPDDASKATSPLVLLSAGVGATPMVSIMDAVLSPGSKTQSRPIRWIHSARRNSTLCFNDHVRRTTREKDNVQARVFVKEVEPSDEQGVVYDFRGQLDLAKLDPAQDLFVADPTADYYICGPEAWMLLVREDLKALGVETERIYLELFATGDVPA
jgi:nitric oxide dioxygenase